MDEVHAACDGGGESNAVVGAEDVVVHRLGDADDGEALAVDAGSISQRVLPSDGNQQVDLQVLQHLQHVVGEVQRLAVVRFSLGMQEVRRPRGAHAAGVGARGVQEGAAGAVDSPHDEFVERQRTLLVRGRVVGIVEEKAVPAPTDANGLVSLVDGAVDECFDAGIQAGDVTPSRQNADSHFFSSVDVVSVRSARWPPVMCTNASKGTGNTARGLPAAA
jgi:hypothetical protein